MTTIGPFPLFKVNSFKLKRRIVHIKVFLLLVGRTRPVQIWPKKRRHQKSRTSSSGRRSTKQPTTTNNPKSKFRVDRQQLFVLLVYFSQHHHGMHFFKTHGIGWGWGRLWRILARETVRSPCKVCFCKYLWCVSPGKPFVCNAHAYLLTHTWPIHSILSSSSL